MSKIVEPTVYSIPWVEKYRPQSLNDIAGNVPVIDRLKAFALQGNFPNMSLIGPPGIGKTTAAICLTLDTFHGRAVYKVLNASKERGIKTIQNDVNMFASHRSISAKFKVLVMDEAEYLTDQAQAALREVIGQNIRNCRFIMVCNEGEKLIEAILSRCSPFYFNRLSDGEVSSVLQKILQKEKKQITGDALAEIVIEANGDLRTAINRLETACTGVQFVQDVSFMGNPQMYYAEQVIVAAMTKPFEEVLQMWLQHVKYSNARKFLERCVDMVYYNQNPQLDIRALALSLAEVDWTRGSEETQVLGLLARLGTGVRSSAQQTRVARVQGG